MQIISPPPGLLAYPNQGLGQQMGETISGVGEKIAGMIMAKKVMDDEKAKRTLDYWMKTGEMMGEFDKPTPAIQEAFKRYYGQVPDKGVLATGGKTLEAKKTEAAIKESEANTTYKTALAGKADALSSDKGTQKGLEYAVKYANAKLGKPFEVLGDEERELWTSFYNEGTAMWNAATSKGNVKGTPVTGDSTNWLNRWRTIPIANRKQALADPTLRAKVLAEASALGVQATDLEV